MNAAPIEINLNLANEKVEFTAISSTNQDHPITMDYLPPIGDGEGFLGLELLTMSFAGCVSTAIVALLRKMGKHVGNYKMSVLGYKKENPLALERISFAITVETEDANEEDIQRLSRWLNRSHRYGWQSKTMSKLRTITKLLGVSILPAFSKS